MLCSKKDYINCLNKIVSPPLGFLTEGCAGLNGKATGVVYGEKTEKAEGFLRLLWGLAPFFGGKSENISYENKIRQGIINGTTPTHTEYWGEISDYDQRLVECAPLALILILAPGKFWNPLKNTEKENLFNWLNAANNVKNPDNNWCFFKVLVNLAFKTIGMPYRKDVINKSIEKINSFYVSNGWYTDGKTDQLDYYISFAIHFYSLIYAKLMENDDPHNSRIFKERAMLFARDFIYWFDETGAALAFGRSLIYRFAQCSFWSACVYAQIEPFPTGVMKGIISRNIEWWLDKPIFDENGILSLGYAYPNPEMCEEYNGYGSPYWALKAFLVLALNDNHLFFKAKPLPLPKLDALHVIPEARMTVQRVNDYVIALTSGQWAQFAPAKTSEKYSKLAYSSKYSFSVPLSNDCISAIGGDNMLVIFKNEQGFVRGKCMEYKIKENGEVYSKWSPFDGVIIKTTLTPTKTGHRRKHIISCDGDYTACDCSFSVPPESDGGEIFGNGEKLTVKCLKNTNLTYPDTKMKAVKYELSKGENIIETEIIYPD